MASRPSSLCRRMASSGPLLFYVFCCALALLSCTASSLFVGSAAEDGEDINSDPSRGWSARLEGDTLVVGSGWHVHTRLDLGSPHSLHDPPRANETFLRRRGQSGDTVGAVLVKRGQLHHIFLLWPAGHLEMIWKGDHWLTHDLDIDESSRVRRRLFATPKFDWGGSKFEGCWPGQNNGLRSMKIGFAFDQQFLNNIKGDAAKKAEQAEELISQITSAANTIYENQLGIHIFVSHQLTDPADFDDDGVNIGTTCSPTINEKLEDWKFIGETKLKDKYPNSVAAWMFITRCYPPPGTVGLAYVGTICSPGNGYGVTTDFGKDSAATWLTFTHELGHILGAGHSFENGQGSTGGIMDYGDGKYQGSYQFHPNRKKDICSTLDRTMNKPRWFELKNCWSSYDPEKDKDRVGLWFIGDEWGSCDMDCKPEEDAIAYRRKEVTCRKTKTGPILEDSKCADEKPAEDIDGKPNEKIKKKCEEQPEPCGDVPRWVKGQNTKCHSPYVVGKVDGKVQNLPCGAGKQYEYVCQDAEGKMLERTKCKANEKLTKSLDCRILEVDGEGKAVVDANGKEVAKQCEDRYMWVESLEEWNPSPSCSYDQKGYKVKKIICLDTVTMEAGKEADCIGAKPEASFELIEGLEQCPKNSNKCCLDDACVEHKVEGSCQQESTAVDAAVCAHHAGGRGYMYIFLGSKVRVMQGCDLKHRDQRLGDLSSYFPGLQFSRIDAAITGPDGNSKPMLLFSKDEVVMYSLEESSPLTGFPVKTKDFFPGLTDEGNCPECATRVVTGFFEEDSQTFRLFCGDTKMYCVGQRPWQADKDSKATTWSRRPTQDFGMPQIRGFTSLSGDSWGLLGLDGSSSCTIPSSANLPIPCNKDNSWWKSSHFSAADETPNPCQKLSFCAKCDEAQKECTVCESGFVSVAGKCVHYQTRLRLADAEQFDEQTEATLGDDDKVEGPFDQRKGVDLSKALKMKPMKDGSDEPVTLRKWAMSLWVKGKASAKEALPVLTAKQSETSTLRITWSDCGPGMDFEDTANKTLNWAVSCKAFATKPFKDAWNFVSFDFTASLSVTLNGERMVMEAEVDPISLGDWSLGGPALKQESATPTQPEADQTSSETAPQQRLLVVLATEQDDEEGGKQQQEQQQQGHSEAAATISGSSPVVLADGDSELQVGMLSVLDHEVWPKVTLMALDNGSKALFVLAAILFIGCCVGIYFDYHISEVLPSQVWWHILVEAYILIMNFIFAFSGIILMVGTWAMLATQEIGVTDLFSDGLIAGDLKFLMWPFWIGLFCYLGGLVGIRTARTRKGCLVCIYLMSLVFNICLCAGLYVKISATELHLSGRSDLLGSAASTGNDLYTKGRAPFMKSYYHTYVSLIKGDQYDCDLAEGQTGDCGAELNGAPLMQCQRPHPAARAFQDLVNKYCTKDIDVAGCGHCLETWGQRANMDDWDSLLPTNKIFCRCTTAVISKGVSWVKSANWIVKVVVVNAVLLLFAEVILACFVPSKRDLLAKQADEVYAKAKARLADMRRRRDGNAELREAHRNMEPRHTEVELGSSLHGFAPGPPDGRPRATAKATPLGH
eukprot:CAMPEP_0206479878 /NCGR_PEP_ID=MMETSP0324_2-20121206/36927_1 /ASSEMBLY_ACC=CAM_ASM_000836 /TAXON_ID=2866 /ORGANISM="Crypthecodinium cohnii, Strain Seligo" /LENGTH=1570 /DNA_ID=CAMNT_0053956491 /DNA_START=30 /DNA_END=4739 /DNA_ORIENTATION=+